MKARRRGTSGRCGNGWLEKYNSVIVTVTVNVTASVTVTVTVFAHFFSRRIFARSSHINHSIFVAVCVTVSSPRAG
jgi:hypothetical protein